jgi:hypothetical protein
VQLNHRPWPSSTCSHVEGLFWPSPAAGTIAATHPRSIPPPPSLLCAFLPHCRTRCSRPLVLRFGSQEIGMVMRSFIRRSPDYAQGDEGDGMATMSRSSSLISSSTSIPMKGNTFSPALMCYSLVSTIDLDTNILCSLASIHLRHARCM